MILSKFRKAKGSDKKRVPEPKKLTFYDDKQLKEYFSLSNELGLSTKSGTIEEFKLFLHANDIPVFSLAEVIKYMDEKAQQESKDNAGWKWVPLRNEDIIYNVKFGIEAFRGFNGTITPSSDYYKGPTKIKVIDSTASSHVGFSGFGGSAVETYQHYLRSIQMQNAQMQNAKNNGYTLHQQEHETYGYDIPLHALKKVSLITKKFDGKVSFFVSDYVLASSVPYPDPFLMAVIDNPRLDKGNGRFVIDFWQEPGFGLSQQLA